MEILRKYKNILIAVGIVIVAFVLYSMFFKPSDNQGLVVANQAVATSNFAAGKDVVTLLVDLKSIQLSGEFFARPAFQSLQDFSLPVPQEPKGRTNPFAPVGTDPVTIEGQGDAS